MKIKVEGLHFTYPGGVEALDGIDLVIEPGSAVAIVGQNGAGKTTLVRHFNGLLQPNAGRVLIGDLDTKETTVAKLAARVGYVFQNPDDQLFCKSVVEEIRVGPKNLGFDPVKIETQIKDSLSLTGLEGKEEVNPYDLAPTMRKLVAMASVLAMDTPILILDEPTTGQDERNVKRIAAIVQAELVRGKTVITITHDIDFCAENFGRIIALGQGKVLLDGAAKEVLKEEKTLASTYVDLPQLTRLGNRLGIKQTVTKEEELLREIQAQSR